MWKKNGSAPIGLFLGWLLFLSLIVEAVLLLLEPSSIAYAESGKLTFGYALYAAIGLLFSTPAPVIALFVTLRKKEKISVKEFCRRAVATPHPWKTLLVTGGFCLAALLLATLSKDTSSGACGGIPQEMPR